jgi:hypothetical protein
MAPSDFILIVAPCPFGASLADGWMSRIGAVDRLFENVDRIYVDPFTGAPLGAPIENRHNDKVIEYKLNLFDEVHHRLLEHLILKCRFVYVHTVHLARFILPFYPTGKVVTDMHGIVPEEERLLGRPEHGTFYEGVERVVVTNSHIVVVTDAMRQHLLAKHPDAKPCFTILPIIELHSTALSERRRRIPESRYRAVYAGGTQRWQNVDFMLDVADQAADFCDFDFLSREHQDIRARAEGRPVGGVSTFSVANKEELPRHYLRADFGFVLRDDTAVNRVACPTKLTEYLWFGVIPIVKSPNIGDFLAQNYAYITAEEFCSGVIPDEGSAQAMREQNRGVIDRLLGQFLESSKALSGLRLSNAIHGNTLAGLPIAQRHLLFPNQAELYLFGEATHYSKRDVIEPYNTLLWVLDIEEPVHAFRLIPMLADVIVELESVEIDVENLDFDAMNIHCVTPGVPQNEGVYLRKAQPYFEFHFSQPMKVRAVKPNWTFVAFGTRDTGGAEMATDRKIGIRMRDAASGISKSSSVNVTFNA